MGLSTELLRGYDRVRDVTQAIRHGEDPLISGLSDTQQRHFCHVLLHETGRKGIYVAWNEMQARKALEDFQHFMPEGVVFLPNREVMLYDVSARSFEQTHVRVQALERLLSDDFQLLVTSAEAILHLLTPPERFRSLSLVLEPRHDHADGGNGGAARGAGIRTGGKGRGTRPVRDSRRHSRCVSDWFGTSLPCGILRCGDRFHALFLSGIPALCRNAPNGLPSIRRGKFCIGRMRSPPSRNGSGRSSTAPCRDYCRRCAKRFPRTSAAILASWRTAITSPERINSFPTCCRKPATIFDYAGSGRIVFLEDPTRTNERMENEREDHFRMCETLSEKGVLLPGSFKHAPLCGNPDGRDP